MEGRVLVSGFASGEALVLDEPLSFWGGLDPATGRVVEVGHPQYACVITDRILVMPSGRGSSSSATVLAEAIRLGTGPAGIVLGEVDQIVAIGALIAAELYGIAVPVMVAGPDVLGSVADGMVVRLQADEQTARGKIVPAPPP